MKLNMTMKKPKLNNTTTRTAILVSLPRHLYSITAMRVWIMQYLQARRVEFGSASALFISHGPRGKGGRLSATLGWRIVKEAADALADRQEAAGAPLELVRKLREVSPHSLRHYMAQSMLESGAEYKDIAAVFGHSSTLVTETVYARLDHQRVSELAQSHGPRRARAKQNAASNIAQTEDDARDDRHR